MPSNGIPWNMPCVTCIRSKYKWQVAYSIVSHEKALHNYFIPWLNLPKIYGNFGKGSEISANFQKLWKRFKPVFEKLNPIQTGRFWPSLDWGRGGGVKHPHPHFLKTAKDIDMKLTPLIKHREINPYLSCDVTWRHQGTILDFHGSHLGFLDFVKMLSKLIFSLQICWITSLNNLYSPFCQYSSETSTKNWNENTNGPNMTWAGLQNSVAMATG